MNPNPAKRARRTSSPESPVAATPRPGSSRPAPGSASSTNPALSPTQPYLPPPHVLANQPSHSHSHSHPVLPLPRPSSMVSPRLGTGSSNWSSVWPHHTSSSQNTGESRGLGITGLTVETSSRGGGSSRGDRRSIDARSPSSPGSPGVDEPGASTETGLVFTRDTSSRAPRSMMACTRCRRQKMKCDGPGVQPCRGCRQSGSQCIFEARSRPKSLSVLPGRAPPFFSARAATPTLTTPAGAAAPGFYPSGAQPAPPTLSRTSMAEPYALRAAREPMPPPPPSSLTALTTPYPLQPPHASVTRSPTVVVSHASQVPPQPHPLPGHGHARHGSLTQPSVYHPPTSTSTIPPPFSAARPLSPPRDVELRLRHVESSLRNLASVPASLHHLQHTLNILSSAVDDISSSISPQPTVEITESVWEDYRSRAWPLTPWLVGLREANGLPGLIVDYLGKRSVVDRSENGRQSVDRAYRAVKKEIGRLAAKNAEWTREDVRALGVFGAWTNDTPLVSLAVSHARKLGLDRIWSSRRSNDDWREWIYLSIMDRLSHLVDLLPPSSAGPLAEGWRDRLAGPNGAHPDPAVRDRDHKLLAWLEYAEMLSEVYSAQQSLRREITREESPAAMDGRAIEGLIDIWMRYSQRWEAWAGAWSARTDPLHFNYAIVFTSSPLFLARESVWELLIREAEGRAVLERARDAAFAVVSAICSPEIGRTLVYSFPLFRPILAASLILLVNLSSLPPASPPLISTSHVKDVLRSTFDLIVGARPINWDSTGGLLGEIVEGGNGRIGGEVGSDLWKSFLG